MHKSGAIVAISAGLGLLFLEVPGSIAIATSHGAGAEAGEGQSTRTELVVFEAPGCRYCPVFRRDVVPSYASTPVGRLAPLRFVDVNDPVSERYKLVAPLTMVPTLVLVRDGAEVGRIAGYVGRENTHRLLSTLISGG